MLELDAKKLAFNIEKRIKNDIESQEICGASVLDRPRKQNYGTLHEKRPLRRRCRCENCKKL